MEVFNQWEADIEKSKEQEDKLLALFRQQQKIFQQARAVQSSKLRTLRQLHEQYTKMFLHWIVTAVVVCVLVQTTHSENSKCKATTPCLCTVSPDRKWTLNCRGKGLKTVPKFSGNFTVDVLDLGNNRITKLPAKCFVGIKPTEIVLDKTIISKVDKDAFVGVEDVVETLDMRDNTAEEPLVIPAAVNTLKNLNNLKISVYGSSLPANSFSGLSKIERLTLIGDKLTSVDVNVFNGTEDTLEYLFFNVRKMPTIFPAIATLKNLETLDLYRNDITYLTEKSFKGMDSLIRLGLNSNTLVKGKASVPDDTFKDIGDTLELLAVRECGIMVIPVASFKYLPKLKELDISNNYINEVPTGAFRQLDSLKKLNLGQKPGFLTLNAKSFHGIEDTLQALLLTKSRLDEIPTDALVALTNLLELDLSGNKIDRVPANAFKSLTSLVSVNLEGNKIVTVDRNAFAGMGLSFHHHITPVLHNNHIKKVDFLEEPCFFDSVQLLNNPLDCDCALLNVTRVKGGPYIAGHCLTPATFAGDKVSMARFRDGYKTTCGVTDVVPHCPITSASFGVIAPSMSILVVMAMFTFKL